MESGGWTGRWSVGCAVLFAGFLFLSSVWVFLFVGDTIADAATAAGAVAGLGLAGAGMFSLLGYRDGRQRLRTLAEVRTRLESRGPVSDEEAYGSVPADKRPFFQEVREAVAAFLGCPPDRLRATDSLQTDYRSRELGWVELEWHVVEHLRRKHDLEESDDDVIRDTPAEGTLADLAEQVRRILDSLERRVLDSPDSSSDPAS